MTQFNLNDFGPRWLVYLFIYLCDKLAIFTGIVKDGPLQPAT